MLKTNKTKYNLNKNEIFAILLPYNIKRHRKYNPVEARF